MRIRDVFTQQAFDLTIENNTITTLQAISTSDPLPWVAPSFFDPQINGCLGIGFTASTLTVEGVRTVADECRRHGIGQFAPTVITSSFEVIHHAMTTLTRVCQHDADLNARLPVIHLEGPYLASEDGPRGAHPREHTRDPNWEEFQRWQDAAEGRIRMVTLAPERTGALPFIERLAQAGIVVAIGHTAATPQQIRDAVRAGARTSTHLGNGCHATLPRHDNYLWEQLASDELWGSIISDGHHLPPAILKCIVRSKGLDRLMITCDASSLAGLPPGRYTDWGLDLEILPGGKVVVPGTPFLAGSGCFTDHCVSRIILDTGVTLPQAITMASIRTRELFGLPIPALEVGSRVEHIIFEWQPGEQMNIITTC